LKLSLEVGAYHWDEYTDVNLVTPVMEDATTPPDQEYIDVYSTGSVYLNAVTFVSAVAVLASLM